MADGCVSRVELEEQLVAMMRSYRAAGREDAQDAMVDVLDRVVGWCAPAACFADCGCCHKEQG